MSDADRAARELADRCWDQLLEREPLLGTEVGDERFDDRLPDPSEAGRTLARQQNEAALADLAAIDRAALSPVLRGTIDLLEAIARRQLADLEHRTDRLAVVTHLWGPGQLLAEMGSLQRTDTRERLERYLARLAAVPGYLAALPEIMREGIDSGVLAPSIVVDRAIAQVERLLATPMDESPALAAIAHEDASGRERAAAIAGEAVMPAYERYLTELRSYRSHATATIGLRDLPNGEAMYDAAILAWTTLPLPAREVHDLGLAELERIQEERRESARRMGFEDAAAAIADLRASGTNEAASREELLTIARKQVQRGWDAAPAFFGHLPSANCEVRAVEEYREADMPFAFYHGPTADGSRAGIYYVNTSDLPERPLHQLATTTYHEANPGHHLQVTIEQELPDRPALRRFGGILAGSAFVEGWGLYAERLADEMGLYRNEAERLGMLDMQAFRACRLVADTGIHALGWDRERAIAQMMESGLPRLEAEIEVDRYVTMPGQALSYMVGMLEIRRARRDAEVQGGGAFDLRAFHDRVLALGSLPLPALRRELGLA